MRHKRLLLPILLAFTVAACARQQSGYYVTDSATGLRVPTANGENTGGDRGLFTAWRRESDGNRAYAYAGGQNQESTERGFFGTSSSAPRYAYAPQTAYSYAPPQQAPAPAPQQQPARRYAQAPQQPTIMQYHPPRPAPQPRAPQPYARQAYAPQAYPQQAYAQQPYQPPRPQPAGYYAERYGWY